jgi:hypothetical protein
MSDWYTVLLSLGSSGIFSIGTAAGLSKVLVDRSMARYKAGLDKELETHRDKLEQNRKLIEARTGHRIYLSRVQFDAEFSSLKDCFAAAAQLRLSFNGLLPMVGLSEGDQDERLKALSRRLVEMGDKYNVFIAATESVFPFIPENVSAEFETCAKAAFLCMQHIQRDLVKALSPAGHFDADKFRQEFGTAYYRAARLARSRFEQLSVLP